MKYLLFAQLLVDSWIKTSWKTTVMTVAQRGTNLVELLTITLLDWKSKKIH